MERDRRIILYGQDVATFGGLHGVTRGLLERFGPERVMDTPISEEAITGIAAGLGACGYRPIVELISAGLVASCFSQVFFLLGSNRHICPSMPVVVRLPTGTDGGGDDLAHHYCPESLLMQAPYLKVVTPSNPHDAKGLLKTALKGDSPVMFLEHIALYNTIGPVPSEEYTVPFGQACLKRAGIDVTIVTYSSMVDRCLEAAASLAREGIDADVLDLRTLVPLDEEAILNSVKKTGRLVIVHEALERGGPAGEIAFVVMEKGFEYLRAPIRRVAAPNVAASRDWRLEEVCIPGTKQIIDSVKSICSGDLPFATRRNS